MQTCLPARQRRRNVRLSSILNNIFVQQQLTHSVIQLHLLRDKAFGIKKPKEV
jgi:hypothetical protein